MAEIRAEAGIEKRIGFSILAPGITSSTRWTVILNPEGVATMGLLAAGVIAAGPPGAATDIAEH